MTPEPAPTAYRLRPVLEDDAAAVLAAFRSAPDMARQGEVADLGSARRYVAWLRADRRLAYAVTCDDAMVGLVGVTVDVANRSGWVFYWMHADHRGRGLTTRAVATVCDRLLAGALDRLELGHRVDNPASGGVAVAAGFVVEGRERGKFLVDGERVDVLTYGRLVGDPASGLPPLEVDAALDRAPASDTRRP
ncbi:GNAT family N-acetyltransferase [Serinicoccus kebangsaanensis]|uniref:GNAT family N-acetyltransferase n=1 Tax=Serinicoccus kebangsaanensis TaxID=2602069 RepID=UPI00124C3DCA|nr:GNAT family protein [Serinicoccus kebangsaanensis]